MESQNNPTGQIVKKLAILNPYLQGGHVLIAETESAARYIEAARNLSIEAKMFASIDELDAFQPDVVVAITYQEPKLTKYPTYVSLNAPPALLRDVPRFIRNLLSYDGFLTISPSVTTWLQEIGRKYNKTMHIAQAAFSVPRMEFQTCDFRRASAMYMGTNWDGMRHQNFFKLFRDGEYLKCYGPKKSWAKYPASLYGGEIPFDGVSVFNRYRQHAIGLCMGHPAFDKEGIANSRLFEIPASSALAVCSSNELTKSIYGDSVLYVNHHAPTEILVEELIASVEWARSNPGLAQEMAKESHEIFNKNASMELYISNLLELHNKVVIANGYLPVESDKEQLASRSGKISTPKVVFILPKIAQHHTYHAILEDLLSQTYQNTHIIMLVGYEELDPPSQEILSRYGLSRVAFISSHNGEESDRLYVHLDSIHADWVSVLSVTDHLFPNHAAMLVKEYARFKAENANENISIIASDSLEFSYLYHLPEVIEDEHCIYNQNRVRMAAHRNLEDLPIGSMLMHYRKMSRSGFRQGDTKALRPSSFFAAITDDMILKCHEVTCSVNIEAEAVRNGWQKLDHVKFENGKNINVEEMMNYIQELKRIIWSRNKKIEDICKTIHEGNARSWCPNCKNIKAKVPKGEKLNEVMV